MGRGLSGDLHTVIDAFCLGPMSGQNPSSGLIEGSNWLKGVDIVIAFPDERTQRPRVRSVLRVAGQRVFWGALATRDRIAAMAFGTARGTVRPVSALGKIGRTVRTTLQNWGVKCGRPAFDVGGR